MEDEYAIQRRSSRSTSRTPATEVTERIEIQRSEPIVKITKFQSIEEMVIREGHTNEVTTSASSISKQSFAQNDFAVESQNRQNQHKEISKSITQSKALASQVQKKIKRTGVRSTLSSVNGSPVKRVRKTVSSRSDVVPSVQNFASSSSSSTTRRSRIVEQSGNFSSSSSRATRAFESLTPRSADRAHLFYESVKKGEVDVSNSIFMRFYKPLEEWWNYYPKTDNTYSPRSSCRYELAPGMLALPNLSRRSISGVRSPSLSTVRTSWKETETNIDSDTEEWENRTVTTSSTYRVQQHKSVFTRVITSIWTVFTVIYAYTIGSVISAFTSGSSQRQDGYKVPFLLYPMWWLMRAARRVSLWETKTGDCLSKGQRRNWLLALLLLLLVGLPIYFLYAGDTQEEALGQPGRTSFLHWLADGITDVLLVVRSPLTWLLSASYELVELIKSTAILPVNWVVSLGSWLISFGLWMLSPFFWIFAAVTSNKTEDADALKAAYVMPPPIAAPSLSPMVSEINMQVNTEVDVDLLAKRVLESQAFLLLMSQLKDDSSKLQDSKSAGLAKLSQELNELKTQIMSMNLGEETKHNSEHLALLALQGKTRNLERMIRVLQVRLGDAASKACCEKINDQVVAIMGGMLGGADDDAKASAELLTAMKTKLAELEQLEARLAQFSLNLEASQQSKLDELRTQLLKISTASKSSIQIEGTSDERVLAIVKEALAQYDADKTNLVDYALETSGGTILSTRCTENYDYKHGETFFFGLSWFSKEYRPNNPRTIIQPSVHPGECWAFKGATGYVVIELSAKIRIMAVTMEHIPRSLAPNGQIESAPKDFSIWGLVDLKDPEPLFLGKFRYEDNGQPLQSFEVEIEHDAYRNLELRIESNHGHVAYTCVYRFRVHGVPNWS